MNFRLIRACLAAASLAGGVVAARQALSAEPIAYMGHGAMFDANGSELARTDQVILETQQWYIRDLTSRLSKDGQASLASIQREVESLKPAGRERLAINVLLLNWLINHVQVDDPGRLIGKLRGLNRGLLASGSDGKDGFKFSAPLQAVIDRRHLLPSAAGGAIQPLLLVTGVSGAAYRQLCSDHGVPLPPDFGPGSPWTSQGTINAADLFIVRAANAEVLTYTSTAPPGLCVALPRYDAASNTVVADGIICLGQADPTSGPPKVCFWDNQVPSAPLGGMTTFQFTRGTAQAISQWAGGSDLRGEVGGVCSDCHSGQNPYVIHGPVLSALQGATSNLTFPPSAQWYEPIVRTGDTTPWPENPGPMNSPPTCSGCHGSASAPGFAGRLPHLSTNLPSYCGSVFRAAVGASISRPTDTSYPPPAMPPGAPGTLACTPNRPTGDPMRVACNATHTAPCNPSGLLASDIRARSCTPELASLLALCGTAATGDASSRGDPHAVTFDSTPYDFQPAGEFVMLRNAAAFEVQVRQTPVSTATPVGPNAHTGLTSCVSVHTAVAARLGDSRITYQPVPDGNNDRGMTLRIDGKPISLGTKPISVGGGRVMRTAVGNGLEIEFPDRARLVALPGFWGPPNNIWYLNIDVFGAQARDGYAGAILPGQWLPLLPDMTGLGKLPTSITQRYQDLNVKFADAWRVTAADSLFDYAPGTGPSDFVLKNWPPDRPPCIVPGHTGPVAQPIDKRKALESCGPIKDPTLRAQCALDVAATGDLGFVRTYQTTDRLRALAGTPP